MLEIEKPSITSTKKVKKFNNIAEKSRSLNESIERFQKQERSRQNNSVIRAASFRANN
jgi:hypothetical protein